MRFVGIVPFLIALVAGFALAGDYTIRVRLPDENLEGKPISVIDDQVHLLGRDGYAHTFSTGAAKDWAKVSDEFQPYSAATLRGRLMREFGKRFEVTGAGGYLVVHPAGHKDKWVSRFNDLQRSFMQYFTARGLKPRTPEFPLVAVVYPSQAEFQAAAADEGFRVSRGILGFYSPRSNRVLLYDQQSTTEAGWQENAATIIHEATHQTAFNTGLHNRFAENPRWLVEGLATMFEARGVWNNEQYRKRSDRINFGRLNEFRRLMEQGRARGVIASLIQSDDLFRTDPGAAYAGAWALTFYLAEQDTANYLRYLAEQTQLGSFKTYAQSQRKSDFADRFGSDTGMLEVRLMRFVDTLPAG